MLTIKKSLALGAIALGLSFGASAKDWKEIREAKKTGPQGENWETWFGNLMLGIRQSLADITHQKAVGELAELKAILNPTSFEASIINSVEGFYGRKWLNMVHGKY